MLFKTCKTNRWITEGVSIVIQVTFIFAFLTVFFFAYVQEVERTEFQSQLNIVVDSIMNDIEDDLPNIVSKDSTITPENAVILTSGVIDLINEKIALESKDSVNSIAQQNYKIKQKAFNSLLNVIVAAVVSSFLVLLAGFCIQLSEQIKEAMLIVIFVGLTEFTFLQNVAKRYISADPNKIKRTLAGAIQEWIKRNKKI